MKPSEDETIGQRLQRLRLARDLTQQQVADAVGYSDGAISQFETDRSRPPLRALEIFAEFFQVPFPYLAQGEHPPLTTPKHLASSPTELRALAIFRAAPVTAHQAMLEVLKVTARYASGARR
jgi:transcriptional regulator with XRE-family HTH domain